MYNIICLEGKQRTSIYLHDVTKNSKRLLVTLRKEAT